MDLVHTVYTVRSASAIWRSELTVISAHLLRDSAAGKRNNGAMTLLLTRLLEVLFLLCR